jgi:hypothetical protein
MKLKQKQAKANREKHIIVRKQNQISNYLNKQNQRENYRRTINAQIYMPKKL